MDEGQQDNFRALLTEAIVKLCQLEAIYDNELRIEGTVCVMSDRASVMIAHFAESVAGNSQSLDNNVSDNSTSEYVFDQHSDNGVAFIQTEPMLAEVKLEHVLPDESVTFEELGYSSGSLSFMQETDMNANNTPSTTAVGGKKSSGGKHQCPVCDQRFKVKRTLQRHMKGHHASGTAHKCQHCSAPFTTEAALHKHVTSEHGRSRSHNQPTARASADKSSMQYRKGHRNIAFEAEKADSVECDGCLDVSDEMGHGLEADGADSLALLEALEQQDYEKMVDDTHAMENDTGVTDNEPSMPQLSPIDMSPLPKTRSKYWNAEKATVMDYFEKVNIDTPKGIYKYKCHMCHKMFKIRTSLYEHVNSHTGNRRYACDQCGRKFVHHSSLHNHVKNMHMIKAEQESFMRYRCTGCDRGFKYWSQLERHLQSSANNCVKDESPC